MHSAPAWKNPLTRNQPPLRTMRFVALPLAVLALAYTPVLESRQRKISERDSVAAHHAAVEAFRLFQYRYHTFVWQPMVSQEQVIDVEATCEVRVGDFCYGPHNGKIAYGGLGGVRAFQRLGLATNSKTFRKPANLYLSMYTSDLRRQLARIPGDRWMVGEMVRIYSELGQFGRAEDFLKGCRSDAWWCSALRAHVKHVLGEWVASDSLFEVALKAMPPEERCAWLNPSRVIGDKDARKALDEMSCESRERVARRTWWLSDPFLTRPGNERRSAHFSRIVMLALDAASFRRAWATPAMMNAKRVPPMAPPLVTDPDMPLLRQCGSYGNTRYSTGGSAGIIVFLIGYPDLVMRVGPPQYCNTRPASFMPEEPLNINTQYPLHRNAFIPSPAAFMSHLDAPASAWALHEPEPYEWMHEWNRPIYDLSYQAAYFKRGDSVRFIVASNAPSASWSDAAGNAVTAPPVMNGTLLLQEDFDLPSRSSRSEGRGTIVFDTRVPPLRSVASVELSLPRNATGRVRFGTGPDITTGNRVSVSEILLTQPIASPPSTLEDAKPFVLGTSRMPASAPVGLFWEIYGLRAGDTAKVSLLVVPQRGEKPLRLGRADQLSSGQDAVTLEWTEPPAAGRPIEGRSLNVSLASLRRGRYTLSIAVTVDGQSVVESVKTIEIER